MQHDPIVLDPSGVDIQGESARIRERGPVTLVHLPGGVPAWSVTDYAVLKTPAGRPAGLQGRPPALAGVHQR